MAWTTALPALPSGPGALDATRVYIPVEDGRLVGLDRASGRLVWQRPAVASVTPVAAGPGVLVAGPDAVEALDAGDGRPRWRLPLASAPAAAPAVADGLAVVPLRSGVVMALGVDDGRLRWSVEAVAAAPVGVATADGRVYLTAEDGTVVALALADGALAWRATVPGSPTPPAAGEGRVLVGSTNNTAYAFDARSGALAWRWRTGGDVVGAAVGPGRAFFAGLDNRLRGVAASSGNQRWQQGLPTRPAHPPQAVAGAVLVTGVAPEVRAYDAVTGEELGAWVAPADLRGPALADPAPQPYQVAMVVVTRAGMAIGLRPSRLALVEPALAPLAVLPGRILPAP